MNRKTGKILIIIGLLMLLAAFCLTTYNIWSAHNAQKESENIVAQIKANTEAVSDKEYLFNPYMKMPSINIDGHEYIGIIEIPALGLTLPVMSDWDYPSLKISPCRYKGSIYSGDMIIAAHNYRGHFGKIKNLNAGDEMIFTDVKKNRFMYSVVAKEQLKSTAVEEMESGNWPLTLFTCTMGGQSRITIRCEKINK